MTDPDNDNSDLSNVVPSPVLLFAFRTVLVIAVTATVVAVAWWRFW